MKSYICNCCGAEIVINNEKIKKCLYCGNNVAIIPREIIDMNIKKMIPFTLDKDYVIRKYNRSIFNRIREAKKIYVPVKFCSFDFDYLIYYELIIRGDESDTYEDVERLFDGTFNCKPLFGKGKISDVESSNFINTDSRIDFDPVLLEDVSIECSNFDDQYFTKKSLENFTKTFCIKRIEDTIYKVYSENYYITDLNVDSFTTLLPVYIIKYYDGTIRTVPGIKVNERNEKITNYNSLITVMFVALFMSSPILLFFMGSAIPQAYTPQIFMGFLAVIIIIYFLLTKFKIKKTYSFKTDTYKYKKYTFGKRNNKITK